MLWQEARATFRLTIGPNAKSYSVCKFFDMYFFLLQVDFNSMTMSRPQRGAIRRLFEPALWLNYTSSDHYHSFYCKMHRIQV